MKLFGWQITRAQKGLPATYVPNDPVQTGGWFSIISEAFAGAFQAVVQYGNNRDALTDSTVFACVTRIAFDIAKLEIKLVQKTSEGIYIDVPSSSPYWEAIRKPNRYQNRITFVVQWMLSKLLYGNAYILKERDARGIVYAWYVLDPRRVKPLITEDGGIYYQLSADQLAQIADTVLVPASEIIHDPMATLFHPLVGVSPLYACAMSANLSANIGANSSKFFANMSRPSGVLSAPGTISEETAARIKKHWEENFSGVNIGRLAVLGDGLKYEAMSIPPEQAQLIEQLKWTVEDIARCFGMPLFKLGGALPPGSSIEAMNQIYWADCLQGLIESAELAMTEGLGLVRAGYSVEFCLDGLLRMDRRAQVAMLKDAVSAGIMAPDEARQQQNLSPVPGGKYPYLQQQNYSLEALAKRDALADPFNAPLPPPVALPEADEDEDDNEELEKHLRQFEQKLDTVVESINGQLSDLAVKLTTPPPDDDTDTLRLLSAAYTNGLHESVASA